MAWFRRRGKSAPRKRSGKFPKRQFGPVEDIVEQGMLVADVAVRMTVKNAIIMNALKRHVDYDEDQIVEMVRQTVIELAEERAHDAEHIARVREEVRDRGYSSWMDADYGNGDGGTLRHRELVYAGVAEQLAERATNEEYLARTAERARQSAWLEIGDSLAERASQPYYGGGHTEEYARERESRIDELIAGELGDLIAQHQNQSRES